MDHEDVYLMSRYVQEAQPYCDEPVFAAMLFAPSGMMKAGVVGGMFGSGVQYLARKRAQSSSGGLPRRVLLVIGATKVYVLGLEYRRRDLDLSGPVKVWRRDDLEVAGDPTGLFGKIELQVRSTGEQYGFESTGKTGSFKKMFNAIREALQDPTMVAPAT